MAKVLLRDVRSFTVGTSSVQIAGPNKGRAWLAIGAPAPPASNSVLGGAQIANQNVNTTGVKLSYALPAGTTGRLSAWTYYSTSATAEVKLIITRNAVSYQVDYSVGRVARNLGIFLGAGDGVQISVAVGGAVGELGDFVIAVELYQAGPRFSLGIGQPAVLDQGLTIYPGNLPLILPGAAFGGEVNAISDAASRVLNVVDLFYG